uniref:Uncharacterized protein n=1 Tax=Helianthus annuus TaxID=4232 RepID=A0A251VJ58_HELAN
MFAWSTLDRVRYSRVFNVDSTKWMSWLQGSTYMPKYPRYNTMSVVATTSSTPKETNSVSLQIPTLTPTNYTTWAIKMEAVMDAQGLWESVEPVDGIAVDEKKNKTARAFIFQAIPEDVLLQVAKKKTAKEIWESLKTRYVGAARVQKARLHTLTSEFEKMKMKDGESIDEFAGRLSGLASKYNSVGSTLEDEKLELQCIVERHVSGLEVISTR